MIGAIIGDVVGSRFEFKDHSGKDFELFVSGCAATDDSFMTLAIANALLLAKGDYSNLESLAEYSMKQVAQEHPKTMWGGNFYKWLFEGGTKTDSYGNGAAMRISPVGWVATSEEEVKFLSRKVTIPSHNHIEGLKGAEAIAMAIYLARTGKDKEYIKSKMIEYYPQIGDPKFNMNYLFTTYGYDKQGMWVTCQGSVPQAIVAFLEGNDFVDVIKNAVGMGGDSDTIGAMAGSIAEAYYGVSRELEDKALEYLSNDLKGIYYAFNIIKRVRANR